VLTETNQDQHLKNAESLNTKNPVELSIFLFLSTCMSYYLCLFFLSNVSSSNKDNMMFASAIVANYN
jgi:hypothetical protein